MDSELTVDTLKPEYLMFTSSLNVELVYIILKSIIGFTYISFKESRKRHMSALDGVVNTEDEDTCVKLNNLKI